MNEFKRYFSQDELIYQIDMKATLVDLAKMDEEKASRKELKHRDKLIDHLNERLKHLLYEKH